MARGEEWVVGGGPYLLVLFFGAVIVLVDGQLILRGSPSYLAEVYPDPRRARQVAMLVTVLFHLVMLGVVALVASAGMPDNPGPPDILRRLGVILLLTALAHAVTMVVLSRLRREESEAELAAEQIEARREGLAAPDGVLRTQRGPTGELTPPVPKRRGRARPRR